MTQTLTRTEAALITRKNYMQRSNAAFCGKSGTTAAQEHQLYYSQFVTEETRRHIARFIPVDDLTRALAEDEHLNSISLDQWDVISWRRLDDHQTSRSIAAGNRTGAFCSAIPFNRDAAALAGEDITRSALICIAKEAARQLVHESHAREGAS